MATVDEKVKKYFSSFPKREYPKGQILVFAKEDPEHIFYMQEGKVRQYDVSYRGDEVIVNIFKTGAFFPMSWAINKTPNPYFFKTEGKVVVNVVPTDDAVKFIKDNPDVMFDLLSRLYRGVDGVLGRVVQLMAGTARERIGYELIIESERFGKKDANGGYILSIHEVDLAARSGLSRETVSRELHKFKDVGIVGISKQKITVRDLPLLKKTIK